MRVVSCGNKKNHSNEWVLEFAAMNRRGFLQNLMIGTAAVTADPEQLERLVWRPKLISIPAPPPAWEAYLLRLITTSTSCRTFVGPGPAVTFPRGARVLTTFDETTLGQFRERLGLTCEQFQRRYGHVIDGRPRDFFDAHFEGFVRPGPSAIVRRLRLGVIER
jgi:hypothetical protein